MKNLKDILIQAAQYPAAVEGMLPAGAPVISAALTDAAVKLPVLPDLPIELPDLPAAPQLPEFQAPAGLGALVREVKVTPVDKVVPAVQRRGETRFLY